MTAPWSSGLFSCFDDCGVCLYGYCCAPCLYGENAEKIDGSSCFGACFVWSLLSSCGLCCIVHMSKRQALRSRYGLQEDCNDCLATACCTGCAICQEARELKYRLSQPSAGPTTMQPGAVYAHSSYPQPHHQQQAAYPYPS